MSSNRKEPSGFVVQADEDELLLRHHDEQGRGDRRTTQKTAQTAAAAVAAEMGGRTPVFKDQPGSDPRI